MIKNAILYRIAPASGTRLERKSAAMAAVLAHIDAQAAEIGRNMK